MLPFRKQFVMWLIGFIFIFPVSAKDIAQSEDHPLVSRYPGSEISRFEAIEYSTYMLPMSAPYRVSGRNYTADQTRQLEGKVTRLVYKTTEDASNRQVFENYLAALKQPGFSIVRSCTAQECDATAKVFARFLNQKGVSFHDKAEAHFIIASYVKDGQNPVYIVVLNGRTNSKVNQILVDVIETRGLELGKIVTNADALLDSLLNTGRAQIYDIYFDTGKSDLKPESKDALGAIATVLEKRTDMKLYVVGHTDDTGSLSVNTRLSDERAKAIVSNLVTVHNVSSERLLAAGVGPFSPVSNNDSEEGRAKNRRVELVKRLH